MCASADHIAVAVALPVYSTFTYAVPSRLRPHISLGQRVLVPFGQRRVTGYIIDHVIDGKTPDIKPILEILDESPLFPASMLPFFKWIADYYIYPLGMVIKGALPGGINLYDTLRLRVTPRGQEALVHAEGTPLENEVLGILREAALSLKDLNKVLTADVSPSLIQRLIRYGWIQSQQTLTGKRTGPKQEQFVSLCRPVDPSQNSYERLSAPKKKILHVLATQGTLSVKALNRQIPSASRLIKSLQNKELITIESKIVYRDPLGESIHPDVAPPLTSEQNQAVARLVDALGQGFQTFLLVGVTGSGKTEVYLRLAAEVMLRGKTTLVLVPEIALISQMEKRFRARFGECVALLHSGLSAGERYDQWLRIRRREAPIAIGARSAIFAPFKDLGLIIVDEEHDTSYKQERQLRYNARDLAVVRAKMNHCPAILGSATPSIQSYHNVKTRKFNALHLHQRVEKRPLPEIEIVDLRHIKDMRGFRRFISPQLWQAMQKALEHGEQVLLFLNRRGFASLPLCADCGEPIRCKHCSLSLTLHKALNAYKCHYCGFSKAALTTCQFCGSARIRNLGLGTEKLEDFVRALFPTATVERMDRDTTQRKGSILKILSGLRQQTTDILIGTQMVAKGHDFPNITLVGIICADLSLNFPDFRASERTFQLIAQVAGRSGRGDKPGRVILQTYNPDHFSILCAQNQDSHAFYKEEIHFRRILAYPPFSRMVQMIITGKNANRTAVLAQAIAKDAVSLQSSNTSFSKNVQLMGPIEAPYAKIARYYRWQILMKSNRIDALHGFVRRLIVENRTLVNNRAVKIILDVDPVFMM